MKKKYNFILYDYINDLYLDKFDKFDKNQNFCFFKTPFNETQSGDVLILKQFSNTVFSLNNNSYNPIYKFNYNTKDKMLDKYVKMSKEDLYNELLTRSIVQRISGIDVNNNKICIYYEIMLDGIGYRTFVTIIDKSNGEIKTCRIGDEINKKIPIIGHKILLTKGYLISYLPAFVAMDLDRSLQLGLSKNMTIEVDDNPILFFYKVKLQ